MGKIPTNILIYAHNVQIIIFATPFQSYLEQSYTVFFPAHWSGVYPQVSLSDISCLACILYICTVTLP